MDDHSLIQAIARLDPLILDVAAHPGIPEMLLVVVQGASSTHHDSIRDRISALPDVAHVTTSEASSSILRVHLR